MKILSYFHPSKATAQKNPDVIQREFPKYRLRILSTTFLSYSFFYIVRNNLSPVAKDMGLALSYSKSQVGDILAITAITYGFGKLLMGALSDKSDSRKYLALGLTLTAFCNLLFGSVRSYPLHLGIWALNGFIQGMGWGPCGRSLGHWFSVKERGLTFSYWNISHNVGGGIAGLVAAYSAAQFGWSGAFYIPALLAVLGAVFVFSFHVDTPQSVGLPPVEEYRNDYPVKHTAQSENELSLKEILVKYVFTNKYLWLVAIANFFVYIVRYSLLDWGPTYLREVKGATLQDGGWAVMAIEFGGIPSTILIGWFSDKLGGRRGLVSLLCMLPILLAFTGILLNPPGHLGLDMALFITVGFFVYPPVMLLGVSALDLAGKKAVGAAAGFVGLFGYFGRTFEAKFFGYLAEHYKEAGWDYVMYSILIAVVLSVVLLIPTAKIRPRH